MKTNFTSEQREDPLIQMMEENLRKCVHCGFCLPACPTYSVSGDERESPRGRIYLIKELLESNKPIGRETVVHVDSCLSCLSCVPACPSGVDYQHFIDHARYHIEENYHRPWFVVMFQMIFIQVLSRPLWFKSILNIAKFLSPVSYIFGKKISRLFKLLPRQNVSNLAINRNGLYLGENNKLKRVALLTGCVQDALRPAINQATKRLLNRMGIEIVLSSNVGCCGALSHHMGKNRMTRKMAKANIDAWLEQVDQYGLDQIITNTAGCGTHIKDYGYLLQDDPVYSEKAEKVSGLTLDICEIISEYKLPIRKLNNLPEIIYHDACSLMHGQGITNLPRKQLKSVGFEVAEIPGKHYCCGSAGIYNLLQPTMADELKRRRQEFINNAMESRGIKFVATGNIGCLIQLSNGLKGKICHTVEFLDWATGGPEPQAYNID